MASTNKIEGLGTKEAHTNQTAHFLFNTTITGEVWSILQGPVEKAEVRFKSESPPTFTYDVSFTPTTRGPHQLSVRVDGVEVTQVFVHQSPCELTGRKPLQVIDPAIKCRLGPGIAMGPWEQVYVCEVSKVGKISVYTKSGEKIQTFGGKEGPEGESLFGESRPNYLAIDDERNMYVTTDKDELCKVNREGRLIRSVKEWESPAGRGDLYEPQGVAVHDKQVYVRNKPHSRGGHALVVFDTELKFLRSFGCLGDIAGRFGYEPADVSLDAKGRIYVADCDNDRVQVLDQYGQYLHHFGQEGAGEGELKQPRGVHVHGDYVYVSESGNNRISVFSTSGQFITTFGKYGMGEEELNRPLGITTDRNGLVYFIANNRIQVF